MQILEESYLKTKINLRLLVSTSVSYTHYSTCESTSSWSCCKSNSSFIVGTTVKGAVDDLDLVIETLEKNGFKNRFYIHCDGALFGLMMPFIKLVSLFFPFPVSPSAILIALFDKLFYRP